MSKMKPPKIPENPPPVLREVELKALLATCEKGQGDTSTFKLTNTNFV